MRWNDSSPHVYCPVRNVSANHTSSLVRLDVTGTAVCLTMMGLGSLVSALNVLVLTRPLALTNPSSVLLASVEVMTCLYHLTSLPFWVLQIFPDLYPRADPSGYYLLIPFFVGIVPRLFVAWMSVVVSVWCLICATCPRSAGRHLTNSRALCLTLWLLLSCCFPAVLGAFSVSYGYACYDRAMGCGPRNVFVVRLSLWAWGNLPSIEQLVLFNYVVYVALPTCAFILVNFLAASWILARGGHQKVTFGSAAEMRPPRHCVLVLLMSGYLLTNTLLPLTCLMRYRFHRSMHTMTFRFCPVLLGLDVLLRCLTVVASTFVYYFASSKYRVTLYNMIAVSAYLVLFRRLRTPSKW